MAKVEVNGANTHPVYRFLRSNAKELNKGNGEVGEIAWNFGKFLVDKDGQVIKYWDPTVEPKDLLPEVEKFLN